MSVAHCSTRTICPVFSYLCSLLKFPLLIIVVMHVCDSQISAGLFQYRNYCTNWELSFFIIYHSIFLLYIHDLPDVIFIIAITADDTTLYSKRDHASDLWQQLELDSELESDL